jgi:hypothetical protein
MEYVGSLLDCLSEIVNDDSRHYFRDLIVTGTLFHSGLLLNTDN